MAEVIYVHTIVEHDGEVHLANLPVKRGQVVELSILIGPAETPKTSLTAGALLASDLVGMWQDRTDIDNSADYARQLRNQAQHRER